VPNPPWPALLMDTFVALLLTGHTFWFEVLCVMMTATRMCGFACV
jgi:hypothetical protein